jgi:hypothetical protein
MKDGGYRIVEAVDWRDAKQYLGAAAVSIRRRFVSYDEWYADNQAVKRKIYEGVTMTPLDTAYADRIREAVERGRRAAADVAARYHDIPVHVGLQDEAGDSWCVGDLERCFPSGAVRLQFSHAVAMEEATAALDATEAELVKVVEALVADILDLPTTRGGGA